MAGRLHISVYPRGAVPLLILLAACADSDAMLPEDNAAPVPTGSVAPLTIRAGETATLDASTYFVDPDGDPLSYAAATTNPQVASVAADGSNVVLTGVSKGAAIVTLTARDPHGASAEQHASVRVPNREPVAVGVVPDNTLTMGGSLDIDPRPLFSDPDGETLTYLAQSADSTVAAVEVGGGTVTISAGLPGSVVITITARDGDDGTAEQVFTVEVINSDPEAAQEIPSFNMEPGQTATFDPSGYFTDPDADGHPLTYTVESSDVGVAFAGVNNGTVIIWSFLHGVTTITVTGSDPHGGSASSSFEVTVHNRDPAATKPIPSQEVFVSRSVSIDGGAFFSDADGDTLSYTASSTDSTRVATEVSGSTLMITGVARGAAAVEVTASDGYGGAVSQSFDVAVLNQAPAQAKAMPGRTMSVGQSRIVSAPLYFSDPEGDQLVITASSTDSAVASAVVFPSNGRVSVTGKGAGTATIKVSVDDARGGRADAEFPVSVQTSIPGSFDIELVAYGPITEDYLAVFHTGARRWMEVLSADETPTKVVSAAGDIQCRHPDWVESISVDDLLIQVQAEKRDGTHGTLASAGPCRMQYLVGGSGTRIASYFGRIRFDQADLGHLLERGLLDDLMIHEAGHVLGLGTLWSFNGLLKYPSADFEETVDTHFTGTGAIDAFDAAGGDDYSGAKVPVENQGGGADGHWRESVLGVESMTPTIDYVSEGLLPLSAISIRALADLGYVIDAETADDFQLTSADIVADPAVGPGLDLGDDIDGTRIEIVDERGRVIETILRRGR